MDKKPFMLRDQMPAETQEALKRIRDNFIICMVKRAGGRIAFPVDEVDAADDMLTMTIDEDAATGKKILVLETKSRN